MKKYGLIGYPLGHSFSKNFFNEKFQFVTVACRISNFLNKAVISPSKDST